MASHFSSIGLNLTEQKDFANYFQLAYENGEMVSTQLGIYVKWHIGNGIELWGQLDKNNSAIGLNPHFSGSSKIKVRIENRIKRDNDTVLDGALYCWADPNDREDDGVYPFVFDLPDIATYGDIDIPQIVTAQITGFAHEISAYQNDEAFNNSQDAELKYASESFIPSGLFSLDGADTTPPQAMALFTGHVVETCKMRNPHTDIEFIWAKINTLGGEYDIVIDPEILNGNICIGGVVSGMFWLSGRIIGDYLKMEKRKEKFSLLRFFNKN